MALPGVTTENWLAAIAAYDEVSMSCGIRAEPKRRPILAAKPRSDTDVHATSPLSAAWAVAALDRVAASALVPPVRSAAAPAAPAARTLRRLIAYLPFASKYFAPLRNFRC